MFEKDLATGTQQGTKLVTREFLKKYISFVKSRKAPELSQDCCHYAAGLYGNLRLSATTCDPKKLAVPVTVRSLETMIRLATAHAKLRLANTVETSDLELAFKLLKMTIFTQKSMDDEEEDGNAAEEDQEMAEEPAPAKGAEEVVPLKQMSSRA